MSAQPENASELFDMLLPLGLQAYPDKAREVNGIFLFKLEGEGGGKWTLNCLVSPPKIFKGEPNETDLPNTCTIELSHEDFKKLLQDPNEGMGLYFAGKLAITGKTEIATRLAIFFDITRPNPIQ